MSGFSDGHFQVLRSPAEGLVHAGRELLACGRVRKVEPVILAIDDLFENLLDSELGGSSKIELAGDCVLVAGEDLTMFLGCLDVVEAA